jgi:PAS domain-containing protein
VDVDGAIRRSLAERGDYAMSYRCLWADGSVRQLEGRSGAQWDDAGRPLRLQGVIWDVTGRAEAEERLRHAGQLTALGSWLVAWPMTLTECCKRSPPPPNCSSSDRTILWR